MSTKSRALLSVASVALLTSCKCSFAPTNPGMLVTPTQNDTNAPSTFGSGAHAPHKVGMDMARAVELARSVGNTHRCHFEHRRREYAAL